MAVSRELMFLPLNYQRASCLSVSSWKVGGGKTLFSWSQGGRHNDSVQIADLYACLRDAAAGSAQLKCLHPHLPLHISTHMQPQTLQALH